MHFAANFIHSPCCQRDDPDLCNQNNHAIVYIIFLILDIQQFLKPESNVRSLQAKVMWDICYYFARRGGENINKISKIHSNCPLIQIQV